MNYSDTTVILPTLNEQDSIGVLVNKITDSFKGINVLVVDDGSRDLTQEIVKKISKKSRNVKLYQRDKSRSIKGLTGSAIDGIKLSKTKFVIVMDADLQHPYQKIRDIKQKLQKSDLVVAIRTDVSGWELHRKIVSKSLIYIGYLFLLMRGSSMTKDIFSGYFGVKRSLFLNIFSKNKKRFMMNGYKVLFDFLKCTKNGTLKISEVPYSFASREHGSSKAGARQVLALFRSFLS